MAMAMDLRSLNPGTIVHDRYRILQVLGSGGFGVTYQVLDVRENKTYAMKEYMPRDIAHRLVGTGEVRPISESFQAQYDKFYQKFYQEAQTIFTLRGHPNIVEIMDLFYANNTVYYVMEYVQGMDVKQMLKKNGGRLSWEKLIPLLRQVGYGLKQVHESGLIHCDISPDNIFVNTDGQVKLLDFGAARNIMRGSVETSVIVAKAGFAPCEQMMGKNLGTWTDVYALAATVYCCLTGKVVQDSMERLTNDKTLWPSQMGIPIQAQTEAALKKGLALRVEDRYQSIQEFLLQLLGPDPYESQSSDQMYSRQSYLHQNPPVVTVPGKYAIVGVHGVYLNRRIDITRDFYMGVDSNRCHISFPPRTPGVSKFHARIWTDQNGLLVMDMGSTYGTTVNGKMLVRGQAYRLRSGYILCLGGAEAFRVL